MKKLTLGGSMMGLALGIALAGASGAWAQEPTLSKEEKLSLVAAANKRLMSGYRDNTWIMQTRGTDYDLVPAAAKKAPVAKL